MSMHLAASLTAVVLGFADTSGPQQPGFTHDHGDHGDHDYHFPPEWMENLPDVVRRGEFPDRTGRVVPPAAPRTRLLAGSGCVSPAQFFAYEDSEGLLLTNFSTGALLNLMYDAGEALIAERGDEFDFVGFWVNFTPHHTVGAAFYSSIANDVLGIGLPLFDNRAATMSNSEEVEGVVMMWNINDAQWAPGDGPDAAWVRLVLGQEFEHRFGLFLPPLADGRRLQGDDTCARSSHWDFRVDAQGSSMEALEWIGADPANVEITDQLPLAFNTDIPGGVWSYPDLYVMGYVTADEMDDGLVELRYMEDWPCDGPMHAGPISHFSSADIIETAGVRFPAAEYDAAQKHFRTGWIVIHQPGDAPDQTEREKAADILNQHSDDWITSTLGRGTMDNTIFDDCNCNGAPDIDDIESGESEDVNGNGLPDECESDCNDNGVFDSDDIEEGTSQDCNENGIPDECDIAEKSSGDCNVNGIPDECELLTTETFESGVLSPVGGAAQVFEIDDPPRSLADVVMTFTAHGDLEAEDESIRVFLHGTFLGTIFDTDGSDCADPPDEDTLVVPAHIYDFAVSGRSSARFKLTFSAEVDRTACEGESFMTVSAQLTVPGPNDVNGNSVPDECECLADVNGDGTVDSTDLLAVLSAWGSCDDCPEDIDRDGEVGFFELVAVLHGWGACPK